LRLPISRFHRVGRVYWRAAVLPHDWAMPLAVRWDFASEAVSVHVLCLAVRLWSCPAPAGER
jgi:hypothetical protein